MSRKRVKIADSLALDPTRKFEASQLASFGDAKNPLHNLGHATALFKYDDTDQATGAPGPSALSWLNRLSNFSKGQTQLVAEFTPGVMCHPKTIIIPTVTMNKGEQAMQMWTIGQEATAWAVHDFAEAMGLSEDERNVWLCEVQVYIDPSNFTDEPGKPNVALWAALYRSAFDSCCDAWSGKQDAAFSAKMAATAWHPFGLGSPEAINAARKMGQEKASQCIVTGEAAKESVTIAKREVPAAA